MFRRPTMFGHTKPVAHSNASETNDFQLGGILAKRMSCSTECAAPFLNLAAPAINANFLPLAGFFQSSALPTELPGQALDYISGTALF